MQTWTDRMRAEGMELGIEKGMELGIEKGIAKGREEGVREILGRLLRLRFGELSPRTLKRLAAIRSLDRLTRMAEQASTAETLAELGLA